MRESDFGTITGTGAAATVTLGWVPDYVEVINLTDGDRIDRWHRAMGEGQAVTTTTGSVAKQAANGISSFLGDIANPQGFVIGSAINETGKLLGWLAMRGR